MGVPIAERFRYIDKVFWYIFIILIVMSIIVLFSASSTLAYRATSTWSPIVSHILFLVSGVVVALVIQFLPSWIMRPAAYIILLFAFLLVLATLFPSLPFVCTINGASRWVKIFGIQFQPAELAKLSLIIVTADLLSRVRDGESERTIFGVIVTITGLFCALIMKENMSTAILIAMIIFLMLILGHIRAKYLLILCASVIVFSIATYFFVEFVAVRPNRPLPGILHRLPTQVKRIDNFFARDDDNSTDKLPLLGDMDGSDYQRTLSNVAVVRGGTHFPFGVGPGKSRERDYLPLAFADYIFAIVVEEWGLFGALILIGLYFCILFRACYTSSRYADKAAMLTVIGLALMITCQAFVSMAVAVGLLPVTGQPLPLISRGGTSVVITSVYFGIMMCVAREQNEARLTHSQSVAESYETVTPVNLEDDTVDLGGAEKIDLSI